MKPPLFIWKSGSLDVFDTIAELKQRYPADALSRADVVLYDSLGRLLRASADSNGSTRISCDKHQPPQSDELTALLRRYLERGGMSTDIASSLTLAELIQEVYPSRETSVRSAYKGKRLESGRRLSQEAESKRAPERLSRAFGIAVLAGAFAACLGPWFAMMYYRSRPSGPGFGSIGELGDAVVGSCVAAIAGALLIGIGVFLCVLLHFDVFRSESGKRIGWTIVALVAILLFVGAGVCTAFFVWLVLAGAK